MTSATRVSTGSSPRSTTFRTTSRSEKTPQSRSPSRMATMPTLLAAMVRTASATLALRWIVNRKP